MISLEGVEGKKLATIEHIGGKTIGGKTIFFDYFFL